MGVIGQTLLNPSGVGTGLRPLRLLKVLVFEPALVPPDKVWAFRRPANFLNPSGVGTGLRPVRLLTVGEIVFTPADGDIIYGSAIFPPNIVLVFQQPTAVHGLDSLGNPVVAFSRKYSK